MGVGIFYSDLKRDGRGAGFGVCGLSLVSGDDVEDAVEEITLFVGEALESIGHEGVSYRPRRPVAVNREMTLIGEGCGVPFEVGLQGWQHDFVIEVGGARHVDGWITSNGWYERDIRAQFGVGPKVFSESFSEFYLRLNRYLMLTLMGAGMECYALTGGYCRSTYPRPEPAALNAEKLRLQTWLLRRKDGLFQKRPRQKAA